VSDSNQYNITHFPELTDPQKMTNWTFSWKRLAQVLTYPRPYKPKHKQSLWSPATFHGKRSKSNAKELSVLVFDIDDGLKFELVKSELNYLQIAHIMHTTSSHTMDKNKFRLILPLLAPIEAHLWSAVYVEAMGWFESMFNRRPDEACKDCSRAFFLSYDTGNFEKNVLFDGRIFDWRQRGLRKKAELDEERKKKNAERAKKNRRAKAATSQAQHHNKRWANVDWKYEVKRQLKHEPEARRALAQRIGATIITAISMDGSSWEAAKGFACPDCGRSDATYFAIDPDPHGCTGGFCNHKNTCGDGFRANNFTLFWLARQNGLV
jgi:hypothetical protein